MTLLHVDMKGKALFFKTISVQQNLGRSDFHQVSTSGSLLQSSGNKIVGSVCMSRRETNCLSAAVRYEFRRVFAHCGFAPER